MTGRPKNQSKRKAAGKATAKNKDGTTKYPPISPRQCPWRSPGMKNSRKWHSTATAENVTARRNRVRPCDTSDVSMDSLFMANTKLTGAAHDF